MRSKNLKEENTNEPLVSIVMPLYNAEKYVGEAIRSVINQTYTHWELIIINDGSTDNSLVVAQKYTSERIKVFNQENGGASAARNFGYTQSEGQFIKFFDADDIISANMLELQVARLIDNENCIASAQWGRFYKDDINTFKLNPEECWQDMDAVDWICSSWRKGQSMTQPGIFLIPRKIIEKAGLWNEELSLIDDFEYFARTVLASVGIRFCEKATLFYRSGIINSLSGAKSRKAVESEFLSISLATKWVLAAENSIRTRKICSNAYSNFVYYNYPKFRNLTNLAIQELDKLGFKGFSLEYNYKPKILLDIFGWKTIKQLQILKNELFRPQKGIY